MTPRGNETDRRRVEDALDRIWPEIPTPSEDELHSIARSASAAPRPISAHRGLSRWRLRARLAVAIAGAALLVGSGLGFGLASAITPSGTAGTNFVGLGFLSADGWTVVQSEAFDATGAGRAIAANVPLDPRDRLRDPPNHTLKSLPSGGVIIEATFTPRGVFADDIDFVARTLPLKAVAAKRMGTVDASFAPRVSTYWLRAAVEAYNLEAWIHYGAKQPSAAMVAAAQEQLNRLVVAADDVTIFARPTTVPWGKAALLFGAVRSGNANEVVNLEVKECGLRSFHGVGAARTRDGGTWEGSIMPGIRTEVRAVWNGNPSKPVTVHQQAGVVLTQLSRRLFKVAVAGRTQFWRKRVVVQQRRSGAWRPLKSVVLTDQAGAGSYIWTSAEFRASLPKGSRVRAVFPNRQARPCLLGGVSNELRTT